MTSLLAESTFAHIILIHCNFAYFLLLTPYRFVIQTKSPLTVFTVSNPGQKLLFIFTNCLGYLIQISQFRQLYHSFRNAKSRDAGFYFDTLHIISSAIAALTYHLTISLKPNLHAIILKLIVSNNPWKRQVPRPLFWQREKGVLIFHILVSVVICYEIAINLGILPGIDGRSFGRSVDNGRQVLFAQTSANTTSNFSGWDYAYGFVGIIILYNNIALTYFCTLHLLIGIILVFSVTLQFKQILEQQIHLSLVVIKAKQKIFLVSAEKCVEWPEVRCAYEFVKELAKLVSAANGKLLTSMLASCIILQSRYLDVFVFERKLYTQIAMSFILVGSIIGLILAAETVTNVSYYGFLRL